LSAGIEREKKKELEKLFEEAKNYNKNLMNQSDYTKNLMKRMEKATRKAERAMTHINLMPQLEEKQNALRHNRGKLK
jgi:hypothetical protein